MALLTIDVDLNTLNDAAQELDWDGALALIKAIDLSKASVDFTSQVLVNLLESVKGDIGPEKESEVNEMILKIKEFE